jgi:phosphoribosylformimino-5-aminoimidazole carboxamide ribotide isomerase
MGFEELYVADLDAILGDRPSLHLYKHLGKTAGSRLMVDAGIANLADAKAVLATGVSCLIIGTETLTDPKFVKEAVDKFGFRSLCVSLDMRRGRLLTNAVKLNNSDPVSAAKYFETLGISSFIALDLERVGSLEGLDEHLLEALVKTVGGEIIAGGGIRNVRDLKSLQSLGVNGALIATSLHSGAVTIKQLRDSNLVAL